MATVLQLNNGATSIPLLGFGTAYLGDTFLCQKSAIADALEVGYRHLDTASIYKSEAAIGETLADAFQAGTLTREEVFITSKLWCSEVADVVGAIRKSLSALKLEYLDLYLIHGPLMFLKHPPNLEDIQPLELKKTWQGMEKCVELGLTKAIGLSNFPSSKIAELLQFAKIPPAVNQVEMHPNCQLKKLRETCRKANIQVCAYSPLGAPQLKQRGSSVAVIDNPVIKRIAEKHGKTPAQVVLRWGIQQGVCVLPKSSNKARMIENFQIFDWSLTDEDLGEIDKFEHNRVMNGVLLADGSVHKISIFDEDD